MMENVGFDIPFNIACKLWWKDSRIENSGLQLTITGYSIYKKIKNGPIIDINEKISPKIIIGLNKALKEPYYIVYQKEFNISDSKIVLFDNDAAVLLTLLDGDINQFIDQMYIKES